MNLEDNHRSNTNWHKCLHTYCSTVCVGVLEVRGNTRLRTRSQISHKLLHVELEITKKQGLDCKTLAHVHQSSMALYIWPTRSTVRRHQLYLFSFSASIYVIYEHTLNTLTHYTYIGPNIFMMMNRAANNTRQCTPPHNQPQSVKSQREHEHTTSYCYW